MAIKAQSSGRVATDGVASSARSVSGSWSNPYFTGSGASGSGTGSALSLGGSYDDLMSRLQSIQMSNNLWSAAQADKQMAFQRQSAQEAMKFNHDEADLSRKWQEYMSNTAHQREIKDLQAAGLNPVLSAMGGSGAPVTSGATASGYASQGAKGDTDTSLSGALVSLFGSMLSSQTALANQAVSARSNEAIADKYTSMSKLVAEIQRDTTLSSAKISAMASQYAADRHVDASYLSASINAAAQRYGYDLSAMTQRQIAAFNADVNRQLAERGYQHDFDVREQYPNNIFQAFSSLFGQSFGANGYDINNAKDVLKEYLGMTSGEGSPSIAKQALQKLLYGHTSKTSSNGRSSGGFSR